MIERKGESIPEVIEQPSGPKKAEALPPLSTSTEILLGRILAVSEQTLETLQSLSVLVAVSGMGATVQDGAEPVEVELKEPAEQPKAKRAKK